MPRWSERFDMLEMMLERDYQQSAVRIVDLGGTRCLPTAQGATRPMHCHQQAGRHPAYLLAARPDRAAR